MTTPPMICEGSNCPSRMNCKRAERPEHKHAQFSRCALWTRREAGASACDMYQPIKADLSTFKGIGE